MNYKYTLATNAQVRSEDFGLLFYRAKGPRLYFLSSGDWINCEFFKGQHSLKEWLENHPSKNSFKTLDVSNLNGQLKRLVDEGVIIEHTVI